MAKGKDKANGPAEVVEDKGNLLQIQIQNPCLQVLGMMTGRIIIMPWFIRKSKSHMIQGNASVCGPHGLNLLAEFKTPRRGSMNKNEGETFSFINIMQAIPPNPIGARTERVGLGIQPAGSENGFQEMVL